MSPTILSKIVAHFVSLFSLLQILAPVLQDGSEKPFEAGIRRCPHGNVA